MAETHPQENSGGQEVDPLVDELVERCLRSLQDTEGLRREVDALAHLPGKRAEFALCLFSLELARLGEATARENFAQHAGVLLEAHRDPLLAFKLLKNNAALTARWSRFEPLLTEFDRQQQAQSAPAPEGEPAPVPGQNELDLLEQEKLIRDVYLVRWEAEPLQAALVTLLPLPERRREFALCLFNLELARLGADDAKREFAGRVALLWEAYHDPVVAQELVGPSPELKTMWDDLVPYLEEFFDTSAPDEDEGEFQMEPVAEGAQVVVPTTVPAPSELIEPLPADSAFAPSAPAGSVDWAALAAPTPAAPQEERSTLEAPPGYPQETGVEVMEMGEEVAEVAEAVVPAKPPPPPPPRPDSAEVVVDVVEEAVVEEEEDLAGPRLSMPPPTRAQPPPPPKGPPPPPPPNITPMPGKMQAYRGDTRTPMPGKLPALRDPSRTSGVHKRPVVPPPPPAPTGERPSPESVAFWAHTEKALGLLPDDDGLLSGKQAFAVKTKSERNQLQSFARGVLEKFPTSPPARALAALIHLHLGCHLKEKTLFGKPNEQRTELLRTGLSLVTGDAVAAGHAAVLFENDGNVTLADFGNVVEQVHRFLAYCLQNQLDPTQPASVDKFLAH